MRVLFLCPHGAAKSAIATAMLRDLARREGRDVTASNAGTDPDDQLNPIAVAALAQRGLVFDDAPRLVASSDIDGADVVVSLGCRLDALPSPPRRLVDWSAAPNVSDDVDGLCAWLAERLPALLP